MSEMLDNILNLTKKQRFIYKLFLNINRKEFLIAEIERDLGYTKPQQDLRKILKELIGIQIVVPVRESHYRDIYYKIDKKKLKRFIEEGEILNMSAEYASRTRIIYGV